MSWWPNFLNRLFGKKAKFRAVPIKVEPDYLPEVDVVCSVSAPVDRVDPRTNLPTITPVAMFTAWNEALNMKGEDGKTVGTIEDVVRLLNEGLGPEYSRKYTVAQVRGRKRTLNKRLKKTKGISLPKLKSLPKGGKFNAITARQAMAQGLVLPFIDDWKPTKKANSNV